MPTPIYPSWNDKEFDLLKKMTENTALIADYEIGDVASVAGTANQVLVNGGTAAATGNITLSLPSLISGISRISTTGTTTGVTDLLINPTTKASGNLIDAQVNSVSKFSVTSAGAGTFGGNLTVSGVAYVADGSSAAPSIAFANDTDTGFSRAAANTFDVGTGGLTNTRFTGVASANRYLNVSNAAGGGSPFISAEGGNSTGLLLKTTNSSGVATTALTLDGTQAATLSGNLTVSGNTANFGGADSSPIVNFKAADTGSITLNFGGTTNPDKGRIIYSDNSDVFTFYTADTERVRIFSNGNFGIGTGSTDGGQKLQVNGVLAAGTTGGDRITLSAVSATDQYFLAQNYWNDNGTENVATSARGSWRAVMRNATSNTFNIDWRAANAAAGTFTNLLSLDTSGNATFAGNVTVNGLGNNAIKGDLLFGSGAWPTANYGRSADRVTISSSAGGPVLGLGDMQTGVAANRGATIYLFARGTNGTNDIAGASFISKRENATSGNFASTVEIGVSTASISNPQTRVTIADATTTFANAIAIGNTVQTAASVASTHKVTISIGGSTYYLLATNV